MKSKIARTLGALGFGMPFSALAQNTGWTSPPMSSGPLTSVNNGTNSIIGLTNIILYWVAVVFWVAAVGFVFYAAFLYLTSNGDDNKIAQAKSQLLYSVIAIAIGIMAYGMPVLVNAFLSGH